MNEEMYRNFAINLKEKLGDLVNGSVFVEPHKEIDSVLVKITDNDIFFTRIIYHVESGIERSCDYADEVAAEVLKYYKRNIFKKYVKNYDKGIGKRVATSSCLLSYE